MKKKKVLHLLKSRQFSGAENVAINIIKHSQDNYDSIYCSPFGPIKNKLQEESVKFVLLNKFGVFSIIKVIRDEKPDIIHAHDFSSSILASLFYKQSVVISHLHNNPLWIKKKCLKSYLYKKSSKFYNKILLVSNSILDEYVYSNDIKQKSIVLGNPIKLVKKNDNLPRSIDVLFVGRLTEQKNPLYFLNICSKLSNRLNIVMIGDGELKEQCLDYIKNNNIDNISILGYKNEVHQYMNKSKVLLMTSKWEGFGLVAIEAFNMGVPVVATNVGGLKEIIVSDAGKLYNDTTTAIQEIVKLTTDEQYWEKKSSGAYRRALQLENIDKYSKKINNIYNEILYKKEG